MAVQRFNTIFNPHFIEGEPCKGDYIIERDNFLSPRDILRKYSLGLPIGDDALMQDEEYEDMPDDLTDIFPNAGEDDTFTPVLPQSRAEEATKEDSPSDSQSVAPQ